MKLFVDSANVADIEAALTRGIAGVTTNPSLIAKEGRDPFEVVRDILDLASVPISVEPITVLEMWEFLEIDRSLVIKIPISQEGLERIAYLHREKVKTNVTACMTFNQAILAANAGADYVSLFWNRIRDGGADPFLVVSRVRQVFRESGCKAEIIVGSIRRPEDVEDAFVAGANIVTVPPKILEAMCHHPKTDEVVDQFMADADRLPAPTLPSPSQGLVTGRRSK